MAQKFPTVLAALSAGHLHLTGVILLDPHLTLENADELMSAASGKTKREIEELLARRFPRPEELAMVVAMPVRRARRS